MFTKPTMRELEQRYIHHPPFGTQIERYTTIRLRCLDLAQIIVQLTPCSRDQALALNALDEVMFRANAAIARNENKLEDTTQSLDKA